MASAQKIVIRGIEDLRRIFPSMTVRQIVGVYLQGLERIRHYNSLLDPDASILDEEQNLYLEKIGMYSECCDYLAGYLARCYCAQNGYDL